MLNYSPPHASEQPAVATVPFDWPSCQRHPGWRATLRWPATPWDVQKAYARVLQAFLAQLRNVTAEEQDILLAGGVLAVKSALFSIECALLADCEHRTAIRLADGPAELAYFRGDIDLERLERPRPPLPADRRPQLDGLRSLRATWRLGGPSALPAWIGGDVVALNITPLLSAFVRATRPAVYRGPEMFLRGLAVEAAALSRPLERICGDLSERLSNVEELSSGLRARLQEKVASDVRHYLSFATQHVEQLMRSGRKWPRLVLSGSGGSYAFRLIGTAVRRNGGQVVRFAHAGMSSLTLNDPQPFAFVEMAGCDEYVLSTKAMQSLAASSGASAMLPPESRPRLSAADGDPSFRFPATPRARTGPPLVMYAPTQLRGHQQYLVPDLADPPYMDWQLRLAALLATFPVRLVSKPHPGGVLRGSRHPLEDISPVAYGRFEDELGKADLFVFDNPSSTAFWHALATTKPVVLVNVAGSGFVPAVLPVIQRRCRICPVTYDAANLPQVDVSALREAVCQAPAFQDPSEILELFAGLPVAGPALASER